MSERGQEEAIEAVLSPLRSEEPAATANLHDKYGLFYAPAVPFRLIRSNWFPGMHGDLHGLCLKYLSCAILSRFGTAAWKVAF